MFHLCPRERDVYADFLDEASVVLEKPGLKDVAHQFRAGAQAWDALGNALLPDEVPPFKKTRELMVQRQRLFLEQGGAALAEMQRIDARLDAIKANVAADFPLDQAQVLAFRENLRDHVFKIQEIEQGAIAALQEVMAWRKRPPRASPVY